MNNIRNIIFDLGGIFMQLDFSKTNTAFEKLGLTNFSSLFNQHDCVPLFQNLETGTITEDEFYSSFRKIAGVDLTDDHIRDAWNALLLDFPQERLIWLKNIATRYKVYLLSNTNIIHYKAFQKIFRKSTGEKTFDDYFIKAYYSHDLGMRKPDPASFIKILKAEKLVAGETLFIDDTLKNIEGAKEVGLHTIHLQPPNTVCDLQL